MFLCNIPLRALYLVSITSHIHNWVLFLLWLHPFILSGVISPLISCSILGTYRPGEFLFQYPVILLFHTDHGVLKARILKWFAIPFSSGPHSVRPLHHDLPFLGVPTRPHIESWSGGWEEQPHVQAAWLHGNRRAKEATPPSRSGGAAMRKYPSSKVWETQVRW